MTGYTDAITPEELRLITALQSGLPVCKEPYKVLARNWNMSEQEVVHGIRRLVERGIFKRFGSVVNHRRLGYVANAMVVWDIPDDAVDAIGQTLAREPAVTLCYRRRRQPPVWPYNLYTMLHGKNREQVLTMLADIRRRHRIDWPCIPLFSRRCFRQRGARYLNTGKDKSHDPA